MSAIPVIVRTVDLSWRSFPSPRPGPPPRFTVFEPLEMPTVGANLESLAAGTAACPLHYHLFEEEHFYVVEGTITVRERAPGRTADREFELRAGELIAYPAGTRIAHRFFNAGDVDARVLGVSDRVRGDICVYPDSGKTALRALPQVGVFFPDGEAAAPTAEAHIEQARTRTSGRRVERLTAGARPSHVVGVEDPPERLLTPGGARFYGRPLARHAGARSIFVNHDRIPPGARSSDPHWHAVNHEVFLVLEGRPTLRELRGQRVGPRKLPSFETVDEVRTELAPGDVVSFPGGLATAHCFENHTDADVRILTVGDDHPLDVCGMPGDGTLWVPALEQLGRMTPTDYWAGELGE